MRRMLVPVLASAIGFAAGVNPGAQAAAATPPAVKITVITRTQAALLKTGRLNVRVRAGAGTKLLLKARQAGRSNRFKESRTTFRRKQNKRLSLTLTATGRRVLSGCEHRTVRVVARFRWRGHRGTSSVSTRLARGPGRCPPPVDPPIEPVLPVAMDDAASTDEASATTLDPVANDRDADGGPVRIVAIDDTATTGSVTITDGKVRYDPDGRFEDLAEGESRADSFGYTIENAAGLRSTATVRVVVVGIDDPSQITVSPTLYPPYSPAISDYVVRCENGPVEMDVAAGAGNTVEVDGQAAATGDFTTSVELSVNQGFTFVRDTGATETSHHVRCLPDDFPEWTFEKYLAPRQQWYLVTPGFYNAIFDANGVPVWWFREPAVPRNLNYLEDGTLTWSVGDPGTDASYEIRSLDGSLLNTLKTVGSRTDVHDIQLLPNGNYLLMAENERETPTDITAFGGPDDATILDAELQEIEPDGDLVWSWNSGDHIGLDETGHWWDDYVLGLADTLGFYDVVHINSAEVVGDSIVVSMRHNDAIYSIDRSTGDIEWKLGGTPVPESLTVQDDPYPVPFGGQHDARILADGTLTAHDNGYLQGRPPRAVRFRIDEEAETATLIETMIDPDVPQALCCGSARRSASGSWVMAWGGIGPTEHPVSEFTADGLRTFKLSFDDPAEFSYRAVPVAAGELSPVALRTGMDTRFPRPAP